MTKPPYILKLSSNIDELESVEKFINQYFDYFRLDKDNFNKVLLCVSEAVTNSIHHGNSNDTKKTVTIVLDCESSVLKVKITDEGMGFCIDKIPDPTQSDNILKESGRGIYIIKSISDFVTFDKQSNTLEFQIKCK